MDKQTREGRELAKKLPFGDKIRHFWSYYKAVVIIVLCVAVAIASTVYSVLTKEHFDLEISYYGVNMLTQEQLSSFEEYLSDYIEDINGDGKKSVKIIPVISDMGDQTIQQQTAIQQKLVAELSAGLNPVYLFDEAFYQKMGPEAEKSVMENGYDLREKHEIKEMLMLTDTPIYWCTRLIYDRELNDDDKVLARENAKRAEISVIP